jgi:ferredoxin
MVGPTIREGAIVYDHLNSIQDLPIGWGNEQQGGHYRLKKRTDKKFFGYVVGPHSWKKFLYPPKVRLWQAARDKKGFHVTANEEKVPKYAFMGVRSCELHAIFIQDKVLQGNVYVDPIYKSRRENVFLIAVNCTEPGGTCFCVSMQTGPKALKGFDVALTEVLEEGKHYFLVEVGSEEGEEVIRDVPHREAEAVEIKRCEALIQSAETKMGRSLETEGIKELLYRNAEHPRWEEVAKRCLSCANCTMVCPTCFCTTVEDVNDLKGDHTERWRKWDSCFSMDFSYLHGGPIRSSTRARYRQWMTHKLASWQDQFGTSGCVGCGRCITWCPVGIDITEEARVMRETQPTAKDSY